MYTPFCSVPNPETLIKYTFRIRRQITGHALFPDDLGTNRHILFHRWKEYKSPYFLVLALISNREIHF